MNILEPGGGIFVEFDPAKSERLKKNPKRNCSFEEASSILTSPNTVYDSNSEIPPQNLAIGWVGGRLITLVYETRHSEAFGEYEHLVTLWKTTKEERRRYGID